MKLSKKEFGLGATLIEIQNSKGTYISFSNLGARIVDWIVPTKNEERNIVLGFESASEYLAKDAYQGASIGRVAGRIKNGRFTIGGKDYQATLNNNGNTLHGGKKSFEEKLWLFETFEEETKAGVHFYLTSNDLENGFPGELSIRVTHAFDEDGEWRIDYHGTSTKDTLFNPTNHVYFNLSGDVTQSIGNHMLKLNADEMLMIDEQVIPIGERLNLDEVGLSMKNGRLLSEIFQSQNKQLAFQNGLDHPFYLNESFTEMKQVELSFEDTHLEIYTDRPSVVIFTSNFHEQGPIMRGKKLVHNGGVTFETQVAPDDVDGMVLKAGELFESTTIYKVSALQ